MNKRPWKVLLASNNLDDIHLIEEALAELEELQFSREWLRPCELHLAEQTSDLLGRLADDRFDAVLLDLDIGAGQAAGALVRVEEQAPEVPVIFFARTRRKATRSTSCGKEHRTTWSSRNWIASRWPGRCAAPSSGTGGTRPCDHSCSSTRPRGSIRKADSIASLRALPNCCADLGREPRLFVLELDGLERLRDLYGTEERDLVVMRTTEALRHQFEEAGILGRLGPARFAALQPDDECMGLPQIEGRLRARIRNANGHHSGGCLVQVRIGTAAGPEAVSWLLEAAAETLCENGRSLASAGTAG